MTLDRNLVRERLRFYRELGIGPLYRREPGEAAHPSTSAVAETEAADEPATLDVFMWPRWGKWAANPNLPPIPSGPIVRPPWPERSPQPPAPTGAGPP